MCQPATKRIVLAFLIYFISKLNSLIKEIVSKEISDQDMVQNRPLEVVNKLPRMMKDVRVSG